MLRGRDILVLADDWYGLPSSAQHLFRYMLQGNRIFWWNVLSRLPKLSRKDVARTLEVLRVSLLGDPRARGRRGETEQEQAPYCATPLILPWFKPPFRRLNRSILARRFRQLSQQIGIRSPIVLTTLPCTVDFVQVVDAAAKVYYCVDEWLDYPDFNSCDWKEMEEALLDSVDGFVATSVELYEKRRSGCPSLYLPHGVDYDHFQGPPGGFQPVPVLERLPRPIVGFFGLVAEWVDLKAIATLSKAFPQCSFVLIGKMVTSLAPLKGLANVHCLGPVSYDELPRFASYFDVGLIPFVRSRLTHAVNPLKLLEYFALGIPVVATRLAQLEGSGGPVWLAADEAEYCEALKAALLGREAARGAARELASSNTWRQRAEELSTFLEALLRS